MHTKSPRNLKTVELSKKYKWIKYAQDKQEAITKSNVQEHIKIKQKYLLLFVSLPCCKELSKLLPNLSLKDRLLPAPRIESEKSPCNSLPAFFTTCKFKTFIVLQYEQVLLMR